MSIYEKTNVARALLYWAKNNNGNEAYYLEDRMYAVADNGMVILLTADSYDEAIRKAKANIRPQGEWQYTTHHARRYRICPFCKSEKEDDRSDGWFYCWHCGAKMKGGKE